MSRSTLFLHWAAACVFAAGQAAPSEPTMSDLQWHRRVLIVSSPRDTDRQFLDQQRELSQWKGGDDRDVTVVRIEGDAVTGSRDRAAELRERYRLAANSFSVALIGKDGHVALRSPVVLRGAQLEAAIDAMPMRRSGLR